MGSDYTLADLAEDSGTAAASAGGASGGESTGEWVTDLIDKLDEKGYLDQLIAAQMNGSQPSQERPQEAPGYESVQVQGDAETAEESRDLDAETLRGIMLQLYDNSERIPGVSEDPKLSELIRLVENQPELTNQMIQEHL